MEKSIKKRICVFCGSSSGNNPMYTKEAQWLGRAIAESGYILVYGGANCGTMGTLANAALNANGEVIGVIPSQLAEKVVHTGLSELREVENMHQRKRMMYALADGFVVLPGGFGSLDELFECLTWRQLGLHNKPLGLVSLSGYYDLLLQFLRKSVKEGFIKENYLHNLWVASTAEALLNRMDTAI